MVPVLLQFSPLFCMQQGMTVTRPTSHTQRLSGRLPASPPATELPDLHLLPGPITAVELPRTIRQRMHLHEGK
jgi:hypothetical protein